MSVTGNVVIEAVPCQLPYWDFAAIFHTTWKTKAIVIFYDHRCVQVKKKMWSPNSWQAFPLILKFSLHFTGCGSSYRVP